MRRSDQGHPASPRPPTDACPARAERRSRIVSAVPNGLGRTASGRAAFRPTLPEPNMRPASAGGDSGRAARPTARHSIASARGPIHAQHWAAEARSRRAAAAVRRRLRLPLRPVVPQPDSTQTAPARMRQAPAEKTAIVSSSSCVRPLGSAPTLWAEPPQADRQPAITRPIWGPPCAVEACPTDVTARGHRLDHAIACNGGGQRPGRSP